MAAPSPSVTRVPRIPPGERVYAIGDIHGRFDLLRALVSRIRADSAVRRRARVRLILLGDLIDRGPDSAAVVERCRALATRSDAFVVLKGNHEAMMLDALGGNLNALAVWLRNGGDAALASWGVPEDVIAAGPSRACIAAARQHVPAETLAWLAALPASVCVGDYLFVHAGIRPDVPIARQTPQDMMWIRGEFLESAATHPHVVIHGHSIAETVEVRPNRIGIDTGAYRTGILTALMLEGDDSAVLATGPGDLP